MRIRTGKGGKYLYYACSKQADMGGTACPGLSIPMRQLDAMVTDALCELESVDHCAGGGRDRQVSLGPAMVNAWGAD